MCWLLRRRLAAAGVEVVGAATDAEQAVALVRAARPQVVTLDLEMPGGGLQALELVMRECPTPVVVVSGVSRGAARLTLRAMELGAVDFLLKYAPGADPDPVSFNADLIARVRAAASINLFRSAAPARPTPAKNAGVVVVGASTGGPLALCELLAALPADFPDAVVVVQHLPAAFTSVLVAQLARHSALPVRQAQAGDELMPGQVLVAPGDEHLVLGADCRVTLQPGSERGHCPSIDLTMCSVAQNYGARARGVVLTGMGADGTVGLTAIRARGGATFAQDAASCVVNGMPRRAIERGVVDRVASPQGIARLLASDSRRCEP